MAKWFIVSHLYEHISECLFRRSSLNILHLRWCFLLFFKFKKTVFYFYFFLIITHDTYLSYIKKCRFLNSASRLNSGATCMGRDTCDGALSLSLLLAAPRVNHQPQDGVGASFPYKGALRWSRDLPYINTGSAINDNKETGTQRWDTFLSFSRPGRLILTWKCNDALT